MPPPTACFAYAATLPACRRLIAALEHPLPVTRGRAANVLDSQPPSAAAHLRPALEPLWRAIVVLGDSVHDVQYRFPMERAVDAIERLHRLLPLARPTITPSDLARGRLARAARRVSRLLQDLVEDGEDGDTGADCCSHAHRQPLLDLAHLAA